MAKRFVKQNVLSESDDAGCLSGFLSIFDFNVGNYSQKLLSDKKCESGRALATGCSRKKLDFPSNCEITIKDLDVNPHKDGDERRQKRYNPGVVNVKTRMEEEMSKTQHREIQNSQLEQLQPESGPGRQKHKKKNKKCNVVPDHHVNDLRCSSKSDYGQYNSSNPSERSSASYDLSAFMVQFYYDNYQDKSQANSDIDSFHLSESCVNMKKFNLDEIDSQISEKYFTLQNALNNVATVIQSQKLADSKEQAGNVSVQTRKFIDTLELLRSNKELLVKLIEDPNSPLLKHVQGIQEAFVRSKILGDATSTSDKFQSSFSNRLFRKQGCHNISIKKENRGGSDGSQDISKIVLLKPNPARTKNGSSLEALISSPLSHHSLKHQEEGERTKSYFSLRGIKRRLRHFIGENRKEKHPVSMDRLLDRIQYGIKESVATQKSSVLVRKTSSISHNTSQPSAIGKKKIKSNLTTEHSPCYVKEEAKKHPIEMVAVQDNKGSSTTVSKSLERAVSLSEHNLWYPMFSQGNDNELLVSPRKIIISPPCQSNQESHVDYLVPLSQTLDQNAKAHVTESNQDCIAEDLMPKGIIEILEESDIKSSEDGNFDIPPVHAVICGGYKAEGSSALLDKGMSSDKLQLQIQSLSTAHNSLLIEKLENLDDTLEKHERPSPVSVLEPFFLEDIATPGNSTSEHAGLPLQPQQIDFEEHDDSAVDLEDEEIHHLDRKDDIYDFITTLLQAAGMDCYQILEGWNSFDHFFDPSLFEEAGILHTSLSDGPELLFGCINEVLAEIQERLHGCTTWVSLIKPNIQATLKGVNLMEEVCDIIDRHLQLSQIPLDQIIRKDIEGRGWMELHLEIEAVVNDMADDMLEEIIEEAIPESVQFFYILLETNMLADIFPATD